MNILLTAIYSAEEADVTAMKVSESAFFFLGSMTSDERTQRGAESCFALGSYFSTCKTVYDMEGRDPKLYLPIKIKTNVALAPLFPRRATAALKICEVNRSSFN